MPPNESNCRASVPDLHQVSGTASSQVARADGFRPIEIGEGLDRRFDKDRSWTANERAIDQWVIGPKRSIRHDTAVCERYKTTRAIGDNARRRRSQKAEQQVALEHGPILPTLFPAPDNRQLRPWFRSAFRRSIEIKKVASLH
jgi:hypothetical protein